MIKVGRWANEHKRAAAVILDRQTFYRDAEDTYQGIKDVDMVPNLSPQEPGLRRDRQELHGEARLHQERLRCASWAAPEFLEEAVKELVEEMWEKKKGEKLPPTAGRLG